MKTGFDQELISTFLLRRCGLILVGRWGFVWCIRLWRWGGVPMNSQIFFPRNKELKYILPACEYHSFRHGLLYSTWNRLQFDVGFIPKTLDWRQIVDLTSKFLFWQGRMLTIVPVRVVVVVVVALAMLMLHASMIWWKGIMQCCWCCRWWCHRAQIPRRGVVLLWILWNKFAMI